MFLKTLSLRQFRNYSRQDVSLSPRLNLFVGPNGSGKSNLVEAVAVLATSQSHRGAEAKHLVQWEKDGFALRGLFDGEESFSLEVRQEKGRAKRILLNNAPQKRLRDWVGRAPLVSFSPDDLHLVKGEPSVRRRVLNAALCQVDPHYLETLQRYNKIMAERNAALRQVQDGEEPRGTLEPWDASLLKEGAALTLRRLEFLRAFEPMAQARHAALTSGQETISATYKPSFLIGEGSLDEMIVLNRRRLHDLREGELALGSTLIGPHRDDVEFLLNGNPARAYSSQGQQRTLALAVKLAEHDFLVSRLDRRPVCLLDDMLSELDPARRENLVASLTNGSQCLVTMATLNDWPQIRQALAGDEVQLFEVEEGRFQPKERRIA